MFRSFVQVFALLCGTSFLVMASGLHGLLLPLRGGAEGFSTTSLGLLGTAWAGGFITACLLAPRLVRRVGHVRAFSAFAAIAAIVALMTGILVQATAWIALRALTGFAMAGAYMVIESWLNERATNANRGQIFGLYMVVNFASITAGQMMIGFGDVHNGTFFMLTGVLFCLALIPTAISTASSPKPLTEVQLDLKALYRNSPVAFVGCMLIGVANGAFGTLGAVYGAATGITTTEIALMMSASVMGGALMQIPVGRMSDRTDRRYVLAFVAGAAAIIGILIFLIGSRQATVILFMTAIYGGLAYTLYPVAVAHANDYSDSQNFVKVTGGLLLLYGFGTMVGPILGAWAMEYVAPEGLFAITALAHVSIMTHAIIRSRMRAAMPIAMRDNFQTVPSERATPEGIKLDPRAEAQPD
ncbi:MFS transporter [Phyllobacterium myrsinacearum]|uniref:MFS transporter n=1 Tax=Phyllobacterium myrsinacearum TaxID=28101 RepID=A0A2S9JL12_9HYPH|nr:MFS transporter [Phyllobacterium myrsinacearum]PRD53635.1 MFS transporter [Phyllobacterium myrsinacearum]